MTVSRRPFGVTARGEQVFAYELKNAAGARAVVLDYGATLQSLVVRDAALCERDVVLGYDSHAEYEQNGGPFGATQGRVANRIANARFSLDGREYRLAANNGPHHLHGGERGFDRYVWSAEERGGALRLSRVSPDGEEGYPGKLSVTVEYSLSDGGELSIGYEAETDAPTPVNLTNHSYFNLDGGGSIYGHRLSLAAELFCEAAPDCLPTGRLLEVDGSAFDFRRGRALGEALAQEDAQTALFGGFDHNFVLASRSAARALSSDGALAMDMYTTLPGVQLYTANGMAARRGKGGAEYSGHGALCLETQLFPDALNHYGFPSNVLRPGEKLQSVTVYAFSAVR